VSPFGPLIPPRPDVFSRFPEPTHCPSHYPPSVALYFHNLTNPPSSAIDKDLLCLQELTNPFSRNSLVFTSIQNPGGAGAFLSGCSREHGSRVTSHVLSFACSLFAVSLRFFFALVPFVFKSLQPLFQKHPGWGGIVRTQLIAEKARGHAGACPLRNAGLLRGDYAPAPLAKLATASASEL
jgi:hypothetical protein